MSAKDYNRSAATAERLIKRAGRLINFVKYDQVAQNPLEPYNGPADIRATATKLVDINAVFVDPGQAKSLGISTVTVEQLKGTSKILIMSPGVSTVTDDISGYDEVEDKGTTWKIQFVEKLEPGYKTLLYFVGVSR